MKQVSKFWTECQDDETISQDQNCEHKNMMRIWPRTGNPIMHCNACGFARRLTDAETADAEKEHSRK